MTSSYKKRLQEKAKLKMKPQHIDHGFMNMTEADQKLAIHLLSRGIGLPTEIAEDIVERAFWLRSDEVCKQFCSRRNCCHVVGYDDIF